jgi:hypothetical protein
MIRLIVDLLVGLVAAAVYVYLLFGAQTIARPPPNRTASPDAWTVPKESDRVEGHASWDGIPGKRVCPEANRIVPFSRLPLELVPMIAENLDTTSKVCLALTCKSLMLALDPSNCLQRSSEFKHPDTFSPDSPDSFDVPERSFTAGRWKLLRQLENARYRCCSGCFKLHPVTEFTTWELAREPGKRTCMFGPLVGVVQICTCLKLTFRDKLKLIDQLRLSPDAEMRNRSTGQEEKGTDGPWWHRCMHIEGSVAVQLKSNPILEQTGDLVIHSLYTVTCPQKDLYSILRLCCPHRGLSRYLLDCIVLARPDSMMASHDQDPYMPLMEPMGCSICRWCSTIFSDIRMRPLRTGRRAYPSFRFRVQRNLGRATNMADEKWYRHTDVAFENREDKIGFKGSPWNSWLHDF